MNPVNPASTPSSQDSQSRVPSPAPDAQTFDDKVAAALAKGPESPGSAAASPKHGSTDDGDPVPDAEPGAPNNGALLSPEQVAALTPGGININIGTPSPSEGAGAVDGIDALLSQVASLRAEVAAIEKEQVTNRRTLDELEDDFQQLHGRANRMAVATLRPDIAAIREEQVTNRRTLDALERDFKQLRGRMDALTEAVTHRQILDELERQLTDVINAVRIGAVRNEIENQAAKIRVNMVARPDLPATLDAGQDVSFTLGPFTIVPDRELSPACQHLYIMYRLIDFAGVTATDSGRAEFLRVMDADFKNITITYPSSPWDTTEVDYNEKTVRIKAYSESDLAEQLSEVVKIGTIGEQIGTIRNEIEKEAATIRRNVNIPDLPAALNAEKQDDISFTLGPITIARNRYRYNRDRRVFSPATQHLYIMYRLRNFARLTATDSGRANFLSVKNNTDFKNITITNPDNLEEANSFEADYNEKTIRINVGSDSGLAERLPDDVARICMIGERIDAIKDETEKQAATVRRNMDMPDLSAYPIERESGDIAFVLGPFVIEPDRALSPAIQHLYIMYRVMNFAGLTATDRGRAGFRHVMTDTPFYSIRIAPPNSPENYNAVEVDHNARSVRINVSRYWSVIDYSLLVGWASSYRRQPLSHTTAPGDRAPQTR